MASFQDGNGRNYEIRLAPPVMRRVKERTGVNLWKVLDNELALLHEIAGDGGLLFDVLLACLDVDESAAESWNQEVVDKALNCFFESVLDFFRREITGPLRAAWEKTRPVAEKKRSEAAAKAMAAVESFDPEKELEAYLTSKSSSTSSPASSAPTPTGEPSGS